MRKNLAVRCAAVFGLIFLMPSMATALTYTFTAGSASLRAELAGTTTSVLQGTVPVIVALGGSTVDFDPLSGPNGTLTGLQLDANGTFVLDLDEVLVGYDIINVSNASVVQAPGATAGVSGAGSFNIATIMSGTIAGIGGPPPSTAVSSLNSSTGGSLFISGTQLELALFGVTLASFQSLTGPEIIDVKADFTFFGVVPEPGTALLLGLGLAGLASSSDRRRA